MIEFGVKDFVEIIGLMGTMLACTWKLSSDLTRIGTQLDMHMKADEEKHRTIDRNFDQIAPHSVRFPGGTLPLIQP